VTVFCGVDGAMRSCFIEHNGVDVLDVAVDLASVVGVSRGWMLLFVVLSKIFVMIISYLLVVDLKAPNQS
jgi:hypothetical protein